MRDQFPQILTLVRAGAAFILVLSLWLIALVFRSARSARRNRALDARLDSVMPEGQATGRILRLWHEGGEATTVVPGAMRPTGLLNWLEETRRNAGFEASLPRVLVFIAALSGAGFAMAIFITKSELVAVLAAIAVLTIVWIAVQQRIARRAGIFERQFIDALDLAARSLRAGHPLVGSIQLIAEEIPAPVGELFGQVWQQQELGMPLETALRAAAEDANDDVKLFATSVVIQLRSGGNLADMMGRLAVVIRERNRLARRVRILTTQTQFSKRILLVLPFLMFILLNLINPAYMYPLYSTPGGQVIMLVAGTILLMGWWMMNWMSKLNY